MWELPQTPILQINSKNVGTTTTPILQIHSKNVGTTTNIDFTDQF
ncbi:hypothetical protein G436_2792 [Leptospira interrogans serovar Hardjo str. Norma]|uniref:Uncharacterized protein n=1 Tax=Leptospira interrogans serovar Hardjo str. Norma TaxID=1279460 RepID=A0A0M5L897_LEPIR|nr:hypothetical protein G436_2792 [Leptospira interrogans serovar Hardjo str. Norma]